MLKIVKNAFAITAAVLCFPGLAQADVSDSLQKICSVIAADDKSELRKKVKVVGSDYPLKLQHDYTGISCSGDSLLRTALINNAIETGTLLVKKLPKEDLSAPEKGAKSVYARILGNGMQGSPRVAAINERI